MQVAHRTIKMAQQLLKYIRRRRLLKVILILTITATAVCVFFMMRTSAGVRSKDNSYSFQSFPLYKHKWQPHHSAFIMRKAQATRGTQEQGLGEITEDCHPIEDPSDIETPFKFYIYGVPSELNTDFVKCLHSKPGYKGCYFLHHCGTGPELYRLNTSTKGRQLYKTARNQGKLLQLGYDLSIRDTNMFALEVVIHYKLLHSPFRTLDPEKADAFYIPAYIGLGCLCHNGDSGFMTNSVKKVFQFLDQFSYFKAGKPHFSTLSKIQREEASSNCPYLLHPSTGNITFIGIEEEINPNFFKYRRIKQSAIVVAPYPSYVHYIIKHYQAPLGDLNVNHDALLLGTPDLSSRNVFLLLAAGSRRSNLFRAKLIDQFENKTHDSYDEYFQKDIQPVSSIMLYTVECSVKHRYTTVTWMQHSIFCLQPPGDSPTRKSFYDSILSGCIPVIFTAQYPVKYPFQNYLNYTHFTYTIDSKLIDKYNKQVVDILQGIPKERIAFLHSNIVKVGKWFQYSMPDGHIQEDDDAMTFIMEELGEILFKNTSNKG